MNELQAAKHVQITPPGAIVDNAPFATAAVDTKGFAKLRIIVNLGALDIAIAAMKLQESNDSGMAGATDVPGADFSVAPLTLPAATDDDLSYALFVDLRGRKRYLDLSLTGGNGAAGTQATVTVDLYQASETPNSAAERGFAQEAIV